MFLLILIFVLLIQLCNLYHYHTTKKKLIGLAGIIIVSILTLYDIINKRYQDRKEYKYIRFVQFLIFSICLIFIFYYTYNNKNYPKKHILKHLF